MNVTVIESLFFRLLLNSAIENLETTTCEEINNAHACILYKGHSKDKTQASSYRTISTCPFISKALDFYVRELSLSDWSEAKPETQFLGINSSHELGALLLTEAINHSIKDNNSPVYCLFLDARSAFDLTVREIIIRKLHLIGTTGHRLLYLDNRLKHRKTFVEWDNRVLGPIKDELGFEQGGISSGDLYTVYNGDQLSIAQESRLGVDLGVTTVSSIGQADDVVLLSNDINFLSNLLQLTLDYCSTHHVTLAPEKTKLMAFAAPRHKLLVDYQKAVSPITINQVPISFTDAAEHVGVTRSVHGNLPHIQTRVTAHIKALYSLLPRGLNPAASLRIESIYANPKLLSGVAPLTLTKPEISILHSHHKIILQNLQKLHLNTPECFVMFMGGSVGVTATIHLRQLGLFGMICRNPESILNRIASSKLLSEPDSSSSWFVQIRLICTQYNLPSPLFLLSNPPPKSAFRSLVKKKVIDFWQQQYHAEAKKPSLKYFKPQFMSLKHPHPLWTTSRISPFEVNKSIVVARLLSGRYRSDWHTRHWSQTNKDGNCLLCPGKAIPGTIEHLLVTCEALDSKRITLFDFWKQQSAESPHLQSLISTVLDYNITEYVQFLLDPSVVPVVISGCQKKLFNLDDVFHLTRTFCYAIHRRRLQLLGRFNVWN